MALNRTVGCLSSNPLYTHLRSLRWMSAMPAEVLNTSLPTSLYNFSSYIFNHEFSVLPLGRGQGGAPRLLLLTSRT